MTTEQTIPLNRLFWIGSRGRRIGKPDGIEVLAASIAAHGLRQRLKVFAHPCRKWFQIVEGGRRHAALKHLVTIGQLAADAPISCLVLADSAVPAEFGPAESAKREVLHPDEQCEVFGQLIATSATIEEVAAQFGTTSTTVRQRLKLAGVSPALRARYRQGEFTLDHMRVFALSDDHAAQEAAWDSLPAENQGPMDLQDALTQGTLLTSNPLVLFVGLEAYVAAGGAMVRDALDPEDDEYLADAGLVQHLATAKLQACAEAVRAEGWTWVKAAFRSDYRVGYGRVRPWQENADGEDRERPEPIFTPDEIARCGALVSIADDGSLLVDRGLIHPENVQV